MILNEIRRFYKQNGPQALTCGPPGGLFGIDQEVVTLSDPVANCLRWVSCVPFGELRVPARPNAGRN